MNHNIPENVSTLQPPAGLDELLCAVRRLLDQKGHLAVAIDGRCGSGKTTAAALLAQQLDCTVLHADDFFLQPQQRTPQRLAQPGGNFDRERFRAEALAPLLEHRDAVYQPYDCHTGRLKPPVTAPWKPVIVAEGSYSCHPDLWPCYDLHVFVTADLGTRLERIARRPGVNLENFRTRWIPLEEAYFAAFDLEHRCEVILHT